MARTIKPNSKAITTRRKRLCQTQEQFVASVADCTGFRITVDTLSRIERGHNTYNSTIGAIAKTLGVDPVLLIQESSSGLPRQLDRFVGRQREAKRLDTLFSDSGIRIVTITGGPGNGKTRLAIEFALQREALFPGGCVFVDLSRTTTPSEVASETLRSLGVVVSETSDLIHQASECLTARGRILVLLDNFEQIIDHAQSTVGLWLQAAHQAVFLVTSRRPLELTGEHLVRIQGLGWHPRHPAERSGLDEHPDLELLLDRIGQYDQDIVTRSREINHASRICDIVAGNPLALEIVAERCRHGSLKKTINQLEHDLLNLRSSRKGQPLRHLSLKQAINWSFELLQPLEQRVLCLASQLPAGLNEDSSVGVFGPVVKGAPDAIRDALLELADCGLIETVPRLEQDWYRLPMPILDFANREFTRHILKRERKMLAKSTARYYLDIFAPMRNLTDQGRLGLMNRRLNLEWPNVRVALQAAIQYREFPMAAELLLLVTEGLRIMGQGNELAMLIKLVLDHKDLEEVTRIELLTELALACHDCGDLDGANLAIQEADQYLMGQVGDTVLRYQIASACVKTSEGYFDHASRLIQAVLDQCDGRVDGLAVQAWMLKGRILTEQDEFAGASDALGRAEILAKTTGQDGLHAVILNAQGLARFEMLEFDEAARCFREAEACFSEQSNDWWRAGVLSNLAMVESRCGLLQGAIEHLDAAEEINRRLGNTRWLAANLHNRGTAWFRMGKYEAALAEVARAAALNRRTGNMSWLARNLQLHGRLLIVMKRENEAILVLDEAFTLFRQTSEPESIARNRMYRGIAQVNRGAVKTGLRLLERARRYYESSKRIDSVDLVRLWSYLTIAHHDLNNFNVSKRCLDQSRALRRRKAFDAVRNDAEFQALSRQLRALQKP